MMASKRASLLFSLPVTVFEPCRPTTTLPPLKCAVSVPCWPRLAAGAAVASRRSRHPGSALAVEPPSAHLRPGRSTTPQPASSSSHSRVARARPPSSGCTVSTTHLSPGPTGWPPSAAVGRAGSGSTCGCSTLKDALPCPLPELVSRAIFKARLAALGDTTPPGSRLGQLCAQPLPRGGSSQQPPRSPIPLRLTRRRAPERAITCYKRKVHSAWGDFTDPEKLCVGSRDHESSDPKGWFAESVALVPSVGPPCRSTL